MKKVLAVFDGAHFSNGVFDFVSKLNDIQPVLFTGVFLPSVDYTDVMIYYLGNMAGPLYVPSVDTDSEVMKHNIEQFKEKCRKSNIECRVHDQVSGSILEGIKKETRYADLLVLDGGLFYSNLGEETQEDYLKDTMRNAECPVIVVPEKYTFPQNIILAYDGSRSSVFAIKQFSYLFPELAGLSTVLVYASDEEGSIPDHSYIEELAARHFSDITFLKLEVDPKKYFSTWLMDKSNGMIVAGAYGRSSLSEFLRKNFTEEIISDHHLPVFIAHQ